MPEWILYLLDFLPDWDWLHVLLIALIKVVAIFIPLVLAVAYLPYAERKIIGYMQIRIGPNRVGPRGWLQPIADALKLILKEIIVPTKSNKYLFILAPILAIGPAFAVWSVIPFTDTLVLADINAGLLFVLAMTSVGVYGIIIAGWASNSKYAIMSSLRVGAQIVAYEIAMGFALVGVVMASGSLNLGVIVEGQAGGISSWYIWPLLPLFFVYFISGVAETNRAPFDMAEGESEIVGGFQVEYSGMAYAVFYLAEYANIILISTLTSLMFLGGWLSPLEGFVGADHWLGDSNVLWFFAKACFFAFCFLWIRATFPRYRYDQIMRLGWKVFIPVTIVWLFVEGVMVVAEVGPWAV